MSYCPSGCANLKRKVIPGWKHDEQNVGQLVGAGSSGACKKGRSQPVGQGLHCYSQSILRSMLTAAPPGGTLGQDQPVQQEQRRRSWELRDTGMRAFKRVPRHTLIPLHPHPGPQHLHFSLRPFCRACQKSAGCPRGSSKGTHWARSLMLTLTRLTS